MKIEPEFYKVRRGSMLLETSHYLFVYVEKGKKYYQIDHMQLQPWEKAELELEGMQVVKRYKDRNSPKFTGSRIVIEAVDEDGDHVSFTARDVHVQRDIFRILPGLARSLNANLKKVMKG